MRLMEICSNVASKFFKVGDEVFGQNVFGIHFAGKIKEFYLEPSLDGKGIVNFAKITSDGGAFGGFYINRFHRKD